MLPLSLNIIYFTSLHRKLMKHIHVLEGMAVSVMWSNVVEETGKPWEKHQICVSPLF